MATDAPYELPSPDEVARMCEIHAWRDHLDDETRLLVEMAGDTIRSLMIRVVQSSSRQEVAEYERDIYRAAAQRGAT